MRNKTTLFINTELGMLVTQRTEDGKIVAVSGKPMEIEFYEFDVIKIDDVWYQQTEHIGNLVKIERVEA